MTFEEKPTRVQHQPFFLLNVNIFLFFSPSAVCYIYEKLFNHTCSPSRNCLCTFILTIFSQGCGALSRFHLELKEREIQ